MTARAVAALAALAGLLALAEPARADLVLERTVRDRRWSPFGEETVCARRERVYVADRRVFIEDLLFGRDVLVQLDRGAVVVMQRTARTAQEYRLEDLRAWRVRFAERLREAGARVPGTAAAAEVAAVLAALAGADGREPGVEVKPGADSAELCQRSVLPVRLDRGGRKFAALWIAQEPAGAALLEAYECLGYFPPGLRDELAKVGQVPLRWEGSLVDGLDRVEREERVTAVRVEAVPASRYEVPSGFALGPAAFLAGQAVTADPPGGKEDGDAEPERPVEPAAPAEPKKEEPPAEKKPDRPDRGRR